METTKEIIERAEQVKARLDKMNLVLEGHLDDCNVTIAINPLDDLLDELQLVASTVLVNEIEDRDLRSALLRFARKFEQLDQGMSAGMAPPRAWRSKG